MELTPSPSKAELTIAPIADGLALAGELDIRSSPAMHEALGAFAGKAVTLDFQGVTFVDSSGIKSLVRSVKSGTAVRIVNAPIHIRLLLQLTGLTDLLGVEEPAHPTTGRGRSTR